MNASVIHVRNPWLKTRAETEWDVHNSYVGGWEISDSTAVTIASWWQSPGSVGSAFAALASGAPVVLGDLLDDIRQTRRTLPPDQEADVRALDMLATWAINVSPRDA